MSFHSLSKHFSQHLLLLSLACFLGLPILPLIRLLPPQQAKAAHSTIHVTPLGTDTENCGSILSPCQSIQYAVNQANSGDTILVATGTYTYKPTNDTCSFLTTRSVVCFVDKHLSILGGYSTKDWLNANPKSNPTIIDGQDTYRGVAVVAYNSTAHLRMEGFTIKNGRAQGSSSGSTWDTAAFGGGIWAQNSSVTLKDLIIKNSVASGGDTNSACGGSASGGGLAIQSSPSNQASVLERVTFQDNRAAGGTGADRGGLALGGGLYAYQTIIDGDHLTFTTNLVEAGDSSGSGVAGGLHADALGGGAALQQDSSVRLSNVIATENQAIGGNAGSYGGTYGGGGFGGAIHTEEASLTLSDARIKNNSVLGGRGANGGVGFGGGLEILNSYVILKRMSIVANTAESGGTSVNGGTAGAPGGGGIYLWDSQDLSYQNKMVNILFADNKIVMSPSGSDRFGGGGGGLVIQGTEVEIIHSTFAQNKLGENLKSGQAILAQKYDSIPSSVDLKYSIVANHVNPYTDNTSALTVSEGNTAYLYQGIFANNTNDTNLNNRPLLPGEIIGLDTMIEVDSTAFVSPGSPDYDYHLTSNSPAIDKATNSTTKDDIDGHPRPYNEASDIGSDEYVRPKIVPTPQQVNVIVDDTGTTSSAIIEVEYSPELMNWSAMTTVSWLSLNTLGSKKASGQTGERLTILFDPTRLDLGTYETSILITSQDADSATLQARMRKVEEVFRNYVPLVIR
jgi:hypothetical protein